jgi:hypothetical protein
MHQSDAYWFVFFSCQAMVCSHPFAWMVVPARAKVAHVGLCCRFATHWGMVNVAA